MFRTGTSYVVMKADLETHVQEPIGVFACSEETLKKAISVLNIQEKEKSRIYIKEVFTYIDNTEF